MTYELELLDVGALPLAPGARVRVAPHLTPAVAVVGHRRRRRRRRRRLARERCEATSGEGRPSLLRSRRGRGLGQDWRPRAGPTRQRPSRCPSSAPTDPRVRNRTAMAVTDETDL